MQCTVVQHIRSVAHALTNTWYERAQACREDQPRSGPLHDPVGNARARRRRAQGDAARAQRQAARGRSRSSRTRRARRRRASLVDVQVE